MKPLRWIERIIESLRVSAPKTTGLVVRPCPPSEAFNQLMAHYGNPVRAVPGDAVGKTIERALAAAKGDGTSSEQATS